MIEVGRATAKPAEHIIERAQDSQYLSAYAGKWVLVVNECVVAAEESPQALMNKIPKEATELNSFMMKVPTPDESLLVIVAE